MSEAGQAEQMDWQEKMRLRDEARRLGLCGKCYLNGKKMKMIGQHFLTTYCKRHEPEAIVEVKAA